MFGAEAIGLEHAYTRRATQLEPIAERYSRGSCTQCTNDTRSRSYTPRSILHQVRRKLPTGGKLSFPLEEIRVSAQYTRRQFRDGFHVGAFRRCYDVVSRVAEKSM